MKDRTLIIISIVFVGVLLASVLVYLYGDRLHEAPRDPLGLATINTAQVQKITMTDVTGTQTLEKVGSAWQVEGERVDDTKITSLLSGLSSAREDLVSRKGSAGSAYGLTSDVRKTVTFVSGATTVSFDVGSADRTSGGVYVVKSGANDVYLVQGTTFDVFTSGRFTDWKVATTSVATTTPATSTPALAPKK